MAAEMAKGGSFCGGQEDLGRLADAGNVCALLPGIWTAEGLSRRHLSPKIEDADRNQCAKPPFDPHP